MTETNPGPNGVDSRSKEFWKENPSNPGTRRHLAKTGKGPPQGRKGGTRILAPEPEGEPLKGLFARPLVCNPSGKDIARQS